MTDISTGTVASTVTDRLYIVGAASEIDTYSLVEAAYAQKIAKADTIELKIEENEAIISAYTELQELGNTMLESLELLKQTYLSSDDSVFDDVTSYLSTTATDVDVDSVIGVTVDEDALQGAYTLEVSQIATKMKVNSGEVIDKTAALGLEGDFTLTTENGTDVEISVTADMSLEDIVDAINDVSDDTSVSASLVRTGDNAYTIVLSGTVTGEELVYTNTGSGDDIMSSLGVTSGSSFVDVSQTAQDAIIYLDGLEIVSSSNTIEDVLDGVDLTLYAAMAGETISLEIDYDYSAAKETIEAFADAYNAFREFYDSHQDVSSDGEISDDSILFSDSLLDGMNNQISTILASLFGDDTDSVTNLAEIGIEFDDGNYLEITDEDLLNDVLIDNYDELRELFQTSITYDNDYISLITNETTLTDFNITLDITVDGSGDISSVSVGGDTSLFEYDGNRIIGAEGTIYEGLTFAYVEDVSTSITIDFSQGMADLLYNAIEAYTDTSSGIIQETISNITSTNTDLQDEVDDITDRAEDFYEKQVEKYAQMEVEVAAAEALLATVRALLGIDSDD
jgi:flagellar hook-associated protein 2